MHRAASTLLAISLTGCGERPAEGPATPNIVLISMDTLRADHLGAYGDTRGLTPNLDAFAQRAVVFERAWSQSNATTPSHASMFAGRYPSELGVTAIDKKPRTDLPVLPEILGVYGYHTGSAVAGLQISTAYGLERGFDWHSAPQQVGSFYHTAPAALAWLDSLQDDAPFFLFLHGYDVHDRYLKPGPWGQAWMDPDYSGPATDIVRSPLGVLQLADGWLFAPAKTPVWGLHGRPRVWDARFRTTIDRWIDAHPNEARPFEDRDLAQIRGAYAGAVCWMDAMLGSFFDQLDQRGLLDDSLVVLVSDHGEMLGEHGYVNHSIGMYDEELRVPLIVHFPADEHAGRRVGSQVALLDVLPTLLQVVGAPPPAGIHGLALQDLLAAPEPRERLIFSEGVHNIMSVRSSEHRLTFSGIELRAPWLVPVLSTADLDGPAFDEASTSDPTARAELRRALVSWRQDLVLDNVDTPTIDQAARDQLQREGYWVPPETAP